MTVSNGRVSGDRASWAIAFPATTRDDGRSEIVFIDAGLADATGLAHAAGIDRPGAGVVLFDGDGDATLQIAGFLADHEVAGLDAVHIMSHGVPGGLVLGASILSEENLAVRSPSLVGIGAALKPGGALLLYGCDVGQGAVGQRFIASLSAITGRVVAASTGLTGAVALGGDWDLEASTGPVITRSIAAPSYSGVLTSPITVTPDPVAGTYTANYDVSGGPVPVDSIVTVIEGANYSNASDWASAPASLSFSTGNTTGSDDLDIARVATASILAGVLSVDAGGIVWLGTGSSADEIGTITGAGTSNFKINFTSGLVTDAAVQGLARMVTYSDAIGIAGTAPTATDTVSITATLANESSTTATSGITFTNSHGANNAPTLTLDAPATRPTVITNGAPQVVDASLSLSGTATVTSASVLVQNFQAGDRLGFTNAGGLTGSYNAGTGVLTVTGSGSTAAYQSFLQGVTFSTSSTSTLQRSISFVAGGGLYDSLNGHFYEYVPGAGITWQAAEAAASKLTLDGMHGYLATVTTASEDSFIQTKLNGIGWLGASDAPLSPTAATAASPDNLTIGHWHWVTGPESLTVGTDGLPGDYIFQETAGRGTDRAWPVTNTGGGYTVGSNFTNFAGGEPNDSTSESYLHIFNTTGQWNDYAYNNASIAGHVVEFGGMPGDPVLSVAGSASVNTIASIASSTPVLAAGSDTGASSTDGVTSDTAQTFTGTATAGAAISLSTDGGLTVLGTGLANPGGVWSIATTLAPGTYSVTSTASEYGASTTSAGTPVTVDTTPPTVSVTSVGPVTPGDAADVTSSVTPTISGTVLDNTAGPYSVEVYVDGADSGAATVTGGAWTYTAPTLTQGAHTVAAVATDLAGNVSSLPAAAAVTTLGVDTPPVVGTTSIPTTTASTATLPATEGTTATLQLYAAQAQGEPLTWSIESGPGAPSHGTASVVPAGLVSYTPTANQSASDSFVVAVSDGFGGTATETITVTTAPAAVGGLTLSPSTDSGTLGDGITNNSSPVITGTGDVGDTVTLSADGGVVGSGVVADDGTWSVTPSVALSDGTYSYTATQTNAAEVVSAISAPLSVTIVTSAAPPGIPALDPGSDSGVAGDGITNVDTPRITGTGVNGDVVTLYDGLGIDGHATVSGGVWSITSGALADGVHALTAAETDVAGNLSPATDPLSLTIDTALPVTAATAPVTVPENSSANALGIAAPSSTEFAPGALSVTVASLPSDGTVTVDGTTPLTPGEILTPTQLAGLTFTPTEGTFDQTSSLAYTVTDPAGNSDGGSLVLEIGHAVGNPVIGAFAPVIVAENAELVPIATPTVSDPNYPAIALTVTIDTLPTNGTVYDTSTGPAPLRIGQTLSASEARSLAFTPTRNADNQKSTLTFTVADPDGNATPGSVTLLISQPADNPMPAVTAPVTVTANAAATALGIVAPADAHYDVGQLVIAATGLPNDGSVSLADGSAVAVGQDLTAADLAGLRFTPTGGLSLGRSAFTYQVTDPDGRTGIGTVGLDIGPPAPSVPLLSPGSDSGVAGDDITNVVTPTLTGTGVAGDTVRLVEGSTVLGTATVGPHATWSITTGTLAQGTHAITAVQQDADGNRSAASPALGLAIETAPPAATSLSQTFSHGLVGVAPAGSAITLHSGGAALGTVGPDAQGNWAFLPSILAPGSYALTATVTDAAGNVSAASNAVQVVVAADHSFTIASMVDGLATMSSYSDRDVQQTQATTQPGASVVTQNFGPDGTLATTTTTTPTGMVSQTVTPTATMRNIYDSAGTLIGSVSEAGSASGVAPAHYATTPSVGGASTATDPTDSVVRLLSENQTLLLGGDDTVLLGSGNDTITASGAASVAGGSGKLTFYGGEAAATLGGGSGSATVGGGSGGGSFAGGGAGGNLLAAGGGNTTLVGGSGSSDVLFGGTGSDTLYGSGGGHDTIVGGGGTDLIVAGAADTVFTGSGQSSVYGSAGGHDTVIGSGNGEIVGAGGGNALFGGAGHDTIFSGAGGNALVGGTGSSVLVGGSGSTDFIGGAGTATVSGGAGNDTVWSGTGTMSATLGDGHDTIVLQSGAATVSGGAGPDIYDVIHGDAAGHDLVSGFKTGTDAIDLYGYAAPATIAVSGGNTTLGLSDGTTITLVGITHLAPGSVV